MHEILSDYRDFHALWSDRKLYEIVTADAKIRISDDLRICETLPSRDGKPAWKTGRFVHARVSHLSILDQQPGKVVLGLIKIAQGDEHLLGLRP